MDVMLRLSTSWLFSVEVSEVYSCGAARTIAERMNIVDVLADQLLACVRRNELIHYFLIGKKNFFLLFNYDNPADQICNLDEKAAFHGLFLK